MKYKRPPLYLICAVLMIFSVASLQAANLVKDSSLEYFTEGTIATSTYVLGDWAFNTDSANAGGGKMEVVSDAQDGEIAIKLSRTSTSGDPSFGTYNSSDHSHQIFVTAGHRYVVRVWAMSPDGATMKFQVASYNNGTSNGGWLGDTAYADGLATQTKWTLYQLIYTAPANTLYASIGVRVRNANTNLYIDNFTMQEVDTTTGELYPDPNFDSFIAGNTYGAASTIGAFSYFTANSSAGSMTVITPGQEETTGSVANRLTRTLSSGDLGLATRIPVTAGHNYQITFWGRATSSAALLCTLTGYDNSNNWCGDTYISVNPSSDSTWTQYTRSYTPTNTRSSPYDTYVPSYLTIGFRILTVGTVDFDTMSITDVTPSSLTGTVTNASTGAVISGAAVTLTGASTYTATTNSSGVYTINGVTPADYSFSVTASGYTKYHVSGFTVLGAVTQNAAMTSKTGDWDVYYSSFSNTTGLNLLNSAAVSGTYLRLCTDYADGSSSTGSSAQAWTTNKFSTAAGFVTEFQFKIANTLGQTADGFVFAVQNAGSSAFGWASGPANSVCLRFDTFQNTGEPSNGFIAVCGSATGDLARVNLKSLDINIADGSLHTARIEYGSGFMNVYIDGVIRISKLSVDLSDHNAVDVDGYSYLGFSAGTGGAAEANYIAYWRFQSDYQMPAETPMFTPDGGEYATAKDVTITCATTDAEIHYTTDGSTPSVSSNVYSSPVNMSNGILKAIAYAPGFTASSVKTATYTLSGSVVSISQVKSTPDDSHVAFNGIVTGAFADGMAFVENENRSSGIALQGVTAGTVSNGMRVEVEGTIATSTNGERYVNVTAINSTGTGQIRPFGMNIKNVGGAPSGLQEGIGGAIGLNNIGLLVRTWGSLQYSFTSPVISDGIMECVIDVPWRSGVVFDPDDTFAMVTGAVRCARSETGADLSRLIRPTSARDVICLPDSGWTFNYGPDFTGDPSSITRCGVAAFVTDSSMDGTHRLRLTPAAASSWGQAFRTDKVSTAMGFTTKFAFQISQTSGGGADGIGFIMHNSPSGVTTTAYTRGTSTNAVAVVFDTYKNTGEPNDNTIQIYAGGASGVPVITADLTSRGIDLKDEYAHLAEVTCNPYEGWMSVKIDGIWVLEDVPVDFTLAGAIDSNGMSWIGFSSFTGASWEAHDIINWKFKSNTVINPKYGVSDINLSSDEIEDGFDIDSTGRVVGQTVSVSPFTIEGWFNNGGNMSSIDSLGGDITSPYGMNANGRAVGESCDTDSIMRAFLWNGSTDDLGSLAGDGTISTAWAINDAGSIVGSTSAADDCQLGFIIPDGGTMQSLGTLGGFNGVAFDINNSGIVVGAAEIASGDNHACMWDATLSPIDLGVLPGGSTSVALGINTSSQIAGYCDFINGGRHAFLWVSGAMTDLGTLGGFCSEAYDINNAGQCVGRSQRSDGIWVASLWQDGTLIDLNWRLPAGSDWLLEIAYAINDSGLITGTGTLKSTGQQHAFVLVP
ncbi:MAG: chitobiase/beta-hexosaminidase C-terminal domain-containing protein [Armatimonadota bacterium]|nr:chitobiase/beta-hexosaminidase C-terminal domain-containing protein [bacterium]